MDKLTKLSAAIRLGSTFRPQCFHALFQQGNSCALGAAYEALTGIFEEEVYIQPHVESVFGLVARRFGISDSTHNEITTRNDSGQTREQIAEWLERQGL